MMTDNLHDELGDLSRFVSATRNQKVSDDELGNAQRLLNEKLAARRPRKSRWPVSLAWAAPAALASVVAAVVMIAGPLVSQPAFAQIQRYFSEFDTLYAEVTFEALGMSMWTMEVSTERGGATRIDMGSPSEITHVVNPRDGIMVTLQHDEQTAHRIDLPPQEPEVSIEGLDWLRQIRDFQGDAMLLPEQRTIDGRLANGFELRREQQTIIVWASALDNRPIEVEMLMGPGETARMQVSLQFDVPLDRNAFDTTAPPGYRWIESLD